LAVGTSEGVVLMYDLKTASRLYVLEGHKRPLAACAFSPDGRRLVTVSLEGGVVMVWKVGASFSNFFSLPGAPPRQGGSTGSEPYKIFPITLPESELNVSASLRGS
jgi:WD40 repeat protein